MSDDMMRFRDPVKNRWYTQSLFLEVGYTDQAIYTLTEEDKEYNGKIYPSIKRLYLECADPTEYIFANKYLGGYQHWLRIANNKALADHVDSWRMELEVKLRCEGIEQAKKSAQKGNFNAAKWMADRGWDKTRGRPSKAEVKRQRKFEEEANNIYAADFNRMRQEST